PRGGGGRTPVRRRCARDARRVRGRTVVELVRRAQAGSRIVRHAPRSAARPFHHVRKRNEVKRMRSYGMYDASRGLTLALAAALAGLALWGASEVGTQTTGRFWIAMAIVAGAGLVLAPANHVGTWTKGPRLRVSPGTLVLVVLPVPVRGG